MTWLGLEKDDGLRPYSGGEAEPLYTEEIVPVKKIDGE